MKGSLTLTPGTHLLLVQAVRDPQLAAPWGVGVTLRGESVAAVALSLTP